MYNIVYERFLVTIQGNLSSSLYVCLFVRFASKEFGRALVDTERGSGGCEVSDVLLKLRLQCLARTQNDTLTRKQFVILILVQYYDYHYIG